VTRGPKIDGGKPTDFFGRSWVRVANVDFRALEFPEALVLGLAAIAIPKLPGTSSYHNSSVTMARPYSPVVNSSGPSLALAALVDFPQVQPGAVQPIQDTRGPMVGLPVTAECDHIGLHAVIDPLQSGKRF
jgi:hypothetical protein